MTNRPQHEVPPLAPQLLIPETISSKGEDQHKEEAFVHRASIDTAMEADQLNERVVSSTGDGRVNAQRLGHHNKDDHKQTDGDSEEGEVSIHCLSDSSSILSIGSPAASLSVSENAHNISTHHRSIHTTSDRASQSHALLETAFTMDDNSALPIHDNANDDDTNTSNYSSSKYTTRAASDSLYQFYHVAVDPTQDDRAADIALFSMARPHMRGFHLAWMSFFVAFFTWFAMTPLLQEIARSLDLTKQELWISSVVAVLSSAVTRIGTGPMNDKFGARAIMSATLVAAAIPTGLAGLVIGNAHGLYLVRFCIGVAGGAFVTCQYWSLSLFTREIAGTANALAAGWGNLGGGVAQLLMGSVLFPLFKTMYGGGTGSASGADEVTQAPFDRPSELAWRSILVFPAILSVATAVAVLRYGDDTPKGNVRDQRRHRVQQTSNHGAVASIPSTSTRQQQPPVTAVESVWYNLLSGARHWSTWLLAFQYGCCFGVEIVMIQGAPLYFAEEFGQSTESAAAIASVFGWMNLFARGIGGFCSDMANAKSGLRGRLWCQVFLLTAEGCLVILFSQARTLGGAIVTMAFFSILVQATEGSTYGIVSYVDSSVTGSVAGIVGAGGNVGGACFAALLVYHEYRDGFLFMGLTVLGGALLTALVYIPGHRRLFSGRDSDEILHHRQHAKLPAVIIIAGAASPDFDDKT